MGIRTHGTPSVVTTTCCLGLPVPETLRQLRAQDRSALLRIPLLAVGVAMASGWYLR